MIIPNIPAKQYLDELRVHAKLSDEKIGEAIGLARTTIWRLRTGRHNTTMHEHGIKIANLHASVFGQQKNYGS